MKTRRILLLTTLALALLIGTAWVVLTQTGFSRFIIKGFLSDFIRGRFELGDASLDPLAGRVRLTDLDLKEEAGEQDGQDRSILKAPEILVDVSLNPFGKVGEVQTVRVEKPELDLYLGEKQALDFSKLFNLQAGEDAPGTLPALEIRDMTVHLHLPSEGDLVITLSPVQLSAFPDERDPTRHVLRGECPNPLGGMIRIEGAGFPDRGEFQLTARSEEFFLTEEGASIFGKEVVAFIAEHQLKGWVAPILWLRYPDEEGRLGGGIHADLRDFEVLPPTFTYKLDHLTGKASFSPEDNGTIELIARYTGTDLEELHAKIRIENLEGDDELRLRIQAKKLLVDPRLEKALSGIPVARRIHDAFRFDKGRLDADIYLHTGLREPGPGGTLDSEIEFDFDFHGVEIHFQGFLQEGGGRGRAKFPYDLLLEEGHVLVRNSYVKISEEASLIARGSRGGRIRGWGEFDFKGPGENWIDLKLEGKGVPLDEELRKALAAVLGQEDKLPAHDTSFDHFSPKGLADFRFEARETPGSGPLRFRAEIFPKGASAEWKGFPYPLQDIVGRILIDGERVAFDLDGRRPSGGNRVMRARAKGSFGLQGEPEERTGEIHVVASHVPLDEDLRKALETRLDPELVRRQWEEFSPLGQVDVDFLAWKHAMDPLMNFDLRADLDGVSARYAKFRADLSGIRGRLVLNGNRERSRVEILGLQGKALGGQVLLHGEMEFLGGENGTKPGIQADLSIVGRGIEVGMDLEEVLELEGLLRPQVWELCKPSGEIDVIQKVWRNPGDEKFQKELIVDMRKVTSRADILPDVLSGLSGEIRMDEDRVLRLRNVEGFVGESRLFCEEGAIRSDPEKTTIGLLLSAERYPIDERLANLMQGKVREAYLARKANGQATFSDLKITITVPKTKPEGGSLGLEAWFEGGAQVRAHDLSLEAGLKISDMDGSAVLHEGRFGPGGARFEIELTGMNWVVLDQKFKDGRGKLIATHESFEIGNEAVIRFHKGRLAGIPTARTRGRPLPCFRFEIGESRHMEVNLGCEGLDLESMLRPFETRQKYRGLVSGSLQLSVDMADPTTLELRGEVEVGGENANLGTVPIFRSIYSSMRPEKRPVFKGGRLSFHSEDGKVVIDNFQIRSPILELEAQGELGYDGYLFLTTGFPNLFPGAGPLPEIITLFPNALVTYEIHGYLGNTKTGPRFFLEGKPARRPLLPTPGRLTSIPRIFQ